MEPDRTLKKVEGLGLLAVVRGESRSAALEVVGALIEGGVLGIEVTFTTPEASQVIRDLDEEYGDDILLGAGTLITREQVGRLTRPGPPSSSAQAVTRSFCPPCSGPGFWCCRASSHPRRSCSPAASAHRR